jgi:hypothetical protein
MAMPLGGRGARSTLSAVIRVLADEQQPRRFTQVIFALESSQLRVAVSHYWLQPASSRLQRFIYVVRHGVSRGIQRGTLVRKLSYSVPNVCSSVRSSNITTQR